MNIPEDGRYGRWAGNPEGNPEKPGRCRAEVQEWHGFSLADHQCRRKRSPDSPLGLCAQHQAVATRREKLDGAR